MGDDTRGWDFGRFYDLPFIGMAITSPSSKRWLQVNQTLCDILGYSARELTGKTWVELTHPDDVAADMAEFQRTLRGEIDGYRMDKRFIRKDGAVIYTSLNVKGERSPDGSVDLVFATIADITQRVQAEAALREHSQLFGNLARQVPGVIYQFRLYPDGRSCFPFASEAMWDAYEVTPEEVRDDATIVYSRLHPDDYDAVAASIQRSAETLEPWLAEYRVVLPRQGVRWRSGLARPERLPDGSILWHGFISDSTAQREAREALAESEQRYRVLIEAAPEAIVVFDVDSGGFVDANENALRLFGVTLDEMRSLSPVELSPPTQPDGRDTATLARHYIERAVAGEVLVFEWMHCTRAGRDVPCEVRLVTLPSATRRLVRGSITDITEAKRLQAQLFQSQKMESVGRLAGGVAHDFNNLLTAMKGYLEFSREAAAGNSQLAEDLAAISRGVDSAAALTQQLLTFSRKQIITPQVLDLNDSVARMHAMLRRLLGEDIELRLITAPDLGLVRFDPSQAEQMLVNLAVNARDAMPDGGRLCVETANVVLDAEYVREHPDATAGEYVMLAVSDTGTGMSAETQSHLFEPFFTTKAPGRGTGLGLPMVYGAVTQNGGRIAVYSEPGHGTTFRIYLPRLRDEPLPLAAPPTAPHPRGSETIVVVEDEGAIRTLAVRILSGLGYRTHAFASGAQALRGIAALSEPVDLVMTDVIMPEMKGSELAERLRALYPGIRILFASGYSEDVIAHHGVLEPGVDFLQKPYSIAALARLVRDMLDRPAAE